MTTTPRSFPLKCTAGTVLFHPGQECPGFVSLASGTIRVSLTASSGREVVLYRVTPGGLCLQTFSCLVDGRQYSAEGVAETDLEGEILPHSEFHRRLEEDDAFRNTVFAAVAQRFSDYEKLVEDVALTGFDARLSRALLRLAANGVVDTTHENLAAETASGRAFVSRRLAEFERNGVLIRQRGQIRILDQDALKRIAAGTG